MSDENTLTPVAYEVLRLYGFEELRPVEIHQRTRLPYEAVKTIIEVQADDNRDIARGLVNEHPQISRDVIDRAIQEALAPKPPRKPKPPPASAPAAARALTTAEASAVAEALNPPKPQPKPKPAPKKEPTMTTTQLDLPAVNLDDLADPRGLLEAASSTSDVANEYRQATDALAALYRRMVAARKRVAAEQVRASLMQQLQALDEWIQDAA